MPVAALGSSRAPATHEPPSWRNVKMLAIVSCPIASPIVAMSAQRSEVITAPPAVPREGIRWLAAITDRGKPDTLIVYGHARHARRMGATAWRLGSPPLTSRTAAVG